MWWIWIAFPIAAGLIFVLTRKVDARALKEIEAWRDALGARRSSKRSSTRTAYRDKADKKPKDRRPKPVGALPKELGPLVEIIGEGNVLGQYELAPKVAYARFVTANLLGSSDHQSVLVRLAEPGPTFTATPLPLLDETRHVPNTGIVFKKDPEFSEAYLIEAEARYAKAINAWLSKDLRKLVREHGDVWLHVSGRAMALSVYGTISEEKIDALMELADVFVAEHGADDGPSLFGEAERTNVKEKPVESEADDEDEDEDEE
jgi:hypothetical protein